MAVRAYTIVVAGELSDDAALAFDGLGLARSAGTTILTGRLRDQAELYAVLQRLADLGLTLLCACDDAFMPRAPQLHLGESAVQAPPAATPLRTLAPMSNEQIGTAAEPAANGVLESLEPRAFWQRFGALTTIARPSRHEERVAQHVRDWAAAAGFAVDGDEAGNIVVRVPATPGREGAPTVVLQGHLDMVCERDPSSAYDPAEGRIGLKRDGEWLTADGTTLGADDGVAIAAMMALVEDPSLPHGPLELLMTVAEEVGLEGANGLDPRLVTGSILINLDSEEDGRLTVGCAGSTDTWVRIAAERAPLDAGSRTLGVTVGGGLGGHSGQNIEDGRSNAIKVLGRVLREAGASVPLRLVSLDGGKSRNAIPRDAHAVVAVPEAQVAAFRDAVAASSATVAQAWSASDGGIAATVGDEAAAAADAWTREATERLLDAVALVPSGPLAMSTTVPGLVETSSSLGEAITEGETLTLHSLSRSSNDQALPDVLAAIEATARLAGGELEVKHNYAGWQPNMDSAALAAGRRVYARLFGEEAIVTAVHAGLETAVIGEKVPGLDMLSFGPQIEFPHSPDERVSIPTVERFWRLLVAIVDELSTPVR
jgi:dipeptidase D